MLGKGGGGGGGGAQQFLYRNQVPCDLLSISTHWSNLIFCTCLVHNPWTKGIYDLDKAAAGLAQELEAQERPSDTRLRLAPVELFP